MFSIGTTGITVIRMPIVIRPESIEAKDACIGCATKKRRGPAVQYAYRKRRAARRATAQRECYFRDIAQRLLAERADPQSRPALEALVLDDAAPRTARMHALWALVGMGRLPTEFNARLLAHADADLRAWGVRAAANHRPAQKLKTAIAALANDPSPDVRLQVAIAAGKMSGLDAIDGVDVLTAVLAHSGDDPLIPRIVWQNLHPKIDARPDEFFAAIARDKHHETPGLALILPRVCERLLEHKPFDAASIAMLLGLCATSADAHANSTAAGVQCLANVAKEIQDGELAAADAQGLREACAPVINELRRRPAGDALHVAAVLLAASWNDPSAVEEARALLASGKQTDGVRAEALDALVAVHDEKLLEAVAPLLTAPAETSADLQRRVLASLARVGSGRRSRPGAADLSGAQSRDSAADDRALDRVGRRGEANCWPRSPLARSSARH